MNQYGRRIKEGVVFGFLCKGRGEDGRLIYRFGKTTKTDLDERYEESEQKIVAIERLSNAHGGLNRPERVVMWEHVTDVNHAWDLTQEYLRGRIYESLGFVHESGFGDKFYSSSSTDVQSRLAEKFADVFATMRK